MPAPRKPRLRHVPVRLRVSVDPEAWREIYSVAEGDTALVADVRQYVLGLVNESAAAREGAIVSARRDGA